MNKKLRSLFAFTLISFVSLSAMEEEVKRPLQPLLTTKLENLSNEDASLFEFFFAGFENRDIDHVLMHFVEGYLCYKQPIQCCIRLLLEMGANIDTQEDGWTPLIEASDAGNAALVSFFLKKGADPNKGAKTDTYNITPLLKASEGGMRR